VPRRRPATGTVVSYRLRRSATVRFTVARCVKSKRRRRGGRCRRHLKLRGAFTQSGKAGRNRLHFTGRLRHRRLAAGRYRLVATASAGDRSGPAKRVAFRVLESRTTESK
jgi:hypothetical protein